MGSGIFATDALASFVRVRARARDRNLIRRRTGPIAKANFVSASYRDQQAGSAFDFAQGGFCAPQPSSFDARTGCVEFADVPPLTYANYLDLEKLLTLQNPRSTPHEHDEMLFIIIHQTYELWFKQLLHEFEKIKKGFSAGDLFGAIHSFKRTRTIMKVLVAQVDILETMTPSSFSSFRDRLETASGFQSIQFREVEFVLGYKRESTLKYVKPDFPGADRLQQRLGERTVVDHFYDFLEKRGAKIPAELKNRDVMQPNGPNEQVQQAILKLYKSSPDVSILFELMTDFDEGLQEWRYRHIKLVERTIGAKKGTGGSPGVPFLKESLFKPVFHDLWAIRHEL